MKIQKKIWWFTLGMAIILGAVTLIFTRSGDKPSPDTFGLGDSPIATNNGENVAKNRTVVEERQEEESENNNETPEKLLSNRTIMTTDGTKHSIPLNEILSGGPGKDGIPSIDEPKFVSTNEADKFLGDNEVGLGLSHKGETKFYPFQILVWHEIANDTIGGKPVLVTYCPLCGTGIVFDPRVNGETMEFGVSGQLWQSNLLMYNRTNDPARESLWSQILGEAVVGSFTGTRLAVIPSDVVRYGDWKNENPDTLVLSRDTGATRLYGSDPYGSYYSDDTVSFGATFNDDRLHPKEFILGVKIGDDTKAYHKQSLPVGETHDEFAGEIIKITKTDIGEVRMFRENGDDLPYVGAFWFSWLAVHPDTELFN